MAWRLALDFRVKCSSAVLWGRITFEKCYIVRDVFWFNYHLMQGPSSTSPPYPQPPLSRTKSETDLCDGDEKLGVDNTGVCLWQSERAL